MLGLLISSSILFPLSNLAVLFYLSRIPLPSSLFFTTFIYELLFWNKDLCFRSYFTGFDPDCNAATFGSPFVDKTSSIFNRLFFFYMRFFKLCFWLRVMSKLKTLFLLVLATGVRDICSGIEALFPAPPIIFDFSEFSASSSLSTVFPSLDVRFEFTKLGAPRRFEVL